MLTIHIFTLFPNMFKGVFDEGVIGRAAGKKLVDVNIHDLRPFGLGKHRIIDDAPYGGGDGMVMMVEPIARALEKTLGDDRVRTKVILTTPQGKPFNQRAARKLAGEEKIAIICGRYAGVDERVREHLVDDEISIGDYVLTGGELPAMVIADAVARLIPGVLGNEDSASNDSFPEALEHAQYTRPGDWRGHSVPGVLLSGDHERIRQWREDNSRKRTAERRPDLAAKGK